MYPNTGNRLTTTDDHCDIQNESFSNALLLPVCCAASTNITVLVRPSGVNVHTSFCTATFLVGGRRPLGAWQTLRCGCCRKTKKWWTVQEKCLPRFNSHWETLLKLRTLVRTLARGMPLPLWLAIPYVGPSGRGLSLTSADTGLITPACTWPVYVPGKGW